MSLVRLTEAERQAQRIIKEDLHRHLQAVTGLHRSLNLFVPINRLPPELLAEIFHLSQDWCRNWFPYTHTNVYSECGPCPMSLTWIAITAVCHHWRQVSFQTPTLWTQVDLDRPKFARNCSFPLAKNTLLHIKVTRWDTERDAFFDEIVSLKCILSLDFNLNQRHCFAKTITSYSFPTLTSICIILRPLLHDFATKLKDCEFPAIQRVKLVNTFQILPTWMLHPTLKELILQVDHPQTIDFITLTYHLSQMSQLMLLHMQGFYLHRPGSDHTINAQKLKLPNLHQLTIGPPLDMQHCYLSLLQNLEFPPKT